MAVKYWLGGDASYPTKWAVAANWSGGIPVDGDEVYIDGRANTNSSTSKKYNIMDFSGMTIPNLLKLVIRSAYDGNIGDGTSNWLTMQAAGAGREVEFGGSGFVYIKLNTSGHYITRLIAKGTSASYLKIMGVAGSYFSEVEGATGSLEIANDTRIDLLRVVDNCTVTSGKGIAASGANTTIFQASGTINWASNILNADVVGGTFNWGVSSDAALTGQRRCTGIIRVYRGATFNWQAADTDATAPANTSVLKKFVVYNGGTLSATGTTNRESKKQIGAVSGDISEVWSGGQAQFDNGTGNITVLSGAKIRSRSGTIQFPTALDLSW